MKRDMSYLERAERLRLLASKLPTWCHDVKINMEWDALDLELGIWPGSAESWRAKGTPVLGG